VHRISALGVQMLHCIPSGYATDQFQKAYECEQEIYHFNKQIFEALKIVLNVYISGS